MGVSEQIQEELRQGRTPEEVLELLKSKGLSESNARKFLERAQAVVATGPPSAPSAAPPAVPDEDDAGDGTWSMAAGSFFLVLGTLGTALTYVVAKPGGKFMFLYGAILWGAFAFIRGLARWWRVRESRPFPVLPVGAGVAIPVIIIAGVYWQAARTRSQRQERAVQMVRDEEQRRGIETGGTGTPLDPVSTYIVVLKNGARDPDSQREAAWRLGEMRAAAHDAVPALLDALRSPSATVRRASAEALMKIDPQNPAVVTAVKALLTDPSIEVWATLIGDFVQKGDPDAHKALLARLEDPALWSRERACGILGGLRDNPTFAAPLIIAKLKSDPDWRVQAGCARALGHLGHATAEARAALESVAASQIPDVHKSATDALAKLGPK
jgi:hypothetical protein